MMVRRRATLPTDAQPRPHARLLNADGELIAEGPCFVEEQARRATLEAEREPGELLKERGTLELELETGRTLLVSDRPMVFRLPPGRAGHGRNGFGRLYRLQLIDDSSSQTVDHAQDADAAGGAGEGAPALPERETPAAR